MTIEQITFHSTRPGKHLVVFGAIHGNEHCGPEAISQAVRALQSKEIVLHNGTVTFVPICNPGAYMANQRFIDRNLNRHFYPKETHQNYEDSLDGVLCGLLDHADALLDLHSYQSQGDAFCFLGNTSYEEIDFARALGVDTYVYGWAEAFGKADTEEQRRAAIGTTDYTRMNERSGIAVTLECGHHHNADAPLIGYQGILRALAHFDMISDDPTPAYDVNTQHCIRMEQVFYQEKPGVLAQPWRHAQPVRQGEVIARYEDGEEITATQDGVIVLPKTETDHAIGAEWFYFGVETAFPYPS